ncbi:MAG: glycosyltransferase [Candidatus Hodarchaeales archaeon]|jgi:glycosyltransferase involved in cell wall biosynthesis
MKVSVIIPTYNRPALLQKAIQSVVAQDYEDKEIIVVMDGCDDTFQQYIDISKIYNDIMFYDITHVGCPGALNYGIKHADGDFICILADDDLMSGKDSITKRVNAFDNNTEVIYTGANNIDINGRIMSAHKVKPVDKDRIWNEDYINIQSMIWRKSVHEKLGYFSVDLINNEDWEWKIKCLMECNVKALDEITVSSRYHGHNKSIKNRAMTNKCADILIKRMRSKYGK